MVKLTNEITKKMMRENESGVVHKSTTNGRHERRKKKALEKIMEEKIRVLNSKDKRVVVTKDKMERASLPLAQRVSRPTKVLRNTLFRTTDYFKSKKIIQKKNDFQHFDNFEKKSVLAPNSKVVSYKSKELIDSSSSSSSESDDEEILKAKSAGFSSDSECEKLDKNDNDEGDGCLVVSEENMVVV
jgi:hypothetical protein